ncbi:unnamed protein product [Ceutorhynchus assimilis]|uniref:Regulatory protein zeste n=1 Tax=Ceutorhynchus assimilis TaxID=467358 RepID=A0A9N9MF47_9CUCU|nr:unnamed protein product [Ceutorhynchus assimilis]
MDNEDKKKRGVNWSKAEINLFMNCLLPHINVIENKQTDGVSLREKQTKWKKVHENFIAQNTDQARDLTSLKLKYDNIKRNLKKKIQNNKKQLTKTGGGPPQEEPLLWSEEALYQVLQVSIDGLPSEGDSDALTTPLKKNDPKPSTSYSFRALLEDNPDGEALRTVEIVEIDVVSDIGESSTRAKSGWNLKRKRTISAVDKETSLHAFEALSEKKTDLASEQKKCFEVELHMKLVEEKNQKEEWDIRREILKTESLSNAKYAITNDLCAKDNNKDSKHLKLTQRRKQRSDHWRYKTPNR